MPADIVLQKRFHDLDLSTEAFSAVQYVGTQTVIPPTDFSQLRETVTKQVKSTASRAPRQPDIVFSALQVHRNKPLLHDNSKYIFLFKVMIFHYKHQVD